MSAIRQAATPHDPKYLDELGRQVTALRDQVAAFPLFNGRLIEALSWTAGQTRLIDHGLGRSVRGWVEISPPDATARAALVPAHTASVDTARQIRITATNTATCHVWVF